MHAQHFTVDFFVYVSALGTFDFVHYVFLPDTFMLFSQLYIVNLHIIRLKMLIYVIFYS